MKKKITNEYKVKDEGIFNVQHKGYIERFISAFNPDLEIDFDKDISISLTVKTKEMNSQTFQIINVTLKDSVVELFDPQQVRMDFQNTGTNFTVMTGREFDGKVDKETGEHKSGGDE